MGDASRAAAARQTAGGVTALVVDDDGFTRTLVTSLVRSLGYTVCGSAAGVSDAMRLAIAHRPAIAVVDLDLGEGPTGIDLAHGLRRSDPDIALVMLSSYGDPRWAGVRKEPPLGARWVVKSDVDDVTVLASALTAALERPAVAARERRPDPGAPVSESQMEILRLVAAGHNNAEIARRRSLTEHAVNKAITRLVRQLDIEVGGSANARVLLAREYHRMTRAVSDRRD